MGGRIPGLRWTVEHSEERVVVKASGELDIGRTEDLERELVAATAAGRPKVVVDLSDLSFIDSSGLRCLLVAREAAENNGTVLVLVHLPPIVERVLEVTGTRDLFAVSGSD